MDFTQKKTMQMGIVLIAILAFFGSGCRQHKQLDQAAQVAKDGSQITTGLSQYYQQLDDQVEAFQRQQEISFNQPILPDTLQQQLEQTKSDIRLRQKVAMRLNSLYVTLGNIATNKPDDVQTAVDNLQTAVTSLDGHPLHVNLPGFNGQAIHVPDQDVHDAIKGMLGDLLDLKKVQDVKKGNIAITKVISEFHSIFDLEKPFYVSLSTFCIDQSYAQLTTLIKTGLATPATDIEASVPPFQIKASQTPTTDDAKNNAQFYANLEKVEFEKATYADADSQDNGLQALIAEHQKLTIALEH